jgi:integrase
MYNRASDWELYQGPNPVKKIKMPVVQNARDRFLSIEEADLILRELKRDHRYPNEYRELSDPKLHDITLLSLHTGARASEIFNIKKEDVDFQNGLIALRDTKNTETRYAPMTDTVREILKRRTPPDPNAYIFTDELGNRIKEVSNSFERVVDRLKLNEGVTDRRQRVLFHTCRHSFASWLAIQGTPILTIARLMGHKSIAMSERYSHLSPDHKKDAVMGLEAVFNKGKGKIKGVSDNAS